MTTKILSASLENYLEAILHIVSDRKVARPRDIAQRLGVNNSSVTGALHSLADKDLVNYAPFDVITLTPKGERIARTVLRRHEAIKDFFIKVLAIDEAEADEAACKIEHVISPTIHARFVEFLDFVELCPRGGMDWIKGVGFHCTHGQNLQDCELCIRRCLDDIHDKSAACASASDSPLIELQTGQKGKVTRILMTGTAEERIDALSIQSGDVIEVISNADDLEVIVKGDRHKLGTSEAKGIFVDLV